MSLYLNEIISVAGKPGLHKLVGKRANGLIVESLNGDKKRFSTSLTQKVSFLSDISIYTYDGDKKLDEILKSLHEEFKAGLELVNKKNTGDEIQSFFRQVVEDFDEDQVYNSDIVKLVSWYRLLKDQLDFNQLTEPDSDEKVKEAKKSNSKSNNKKPTTHNAPKAQSKAKGGVKKSGNLKAG